MAQERRVLLANGQYITIVQTTGNSTGDVMSQSAVTAALNTKANVSHTHSTSDITSGTFGTDRIADGAVTAAKVANGAITTAKIQDKSITLAKLGSDVPISTTSYEIVRVSGLTSGGTAAVGAEVMIGGAFYKFDNTGVVSAQIPYGQIYKIQAQSNDIWLCNYDATYTANTSSRTISITYIGVSNGVFIEAIDGMFYTSSNWTSSKTANSIVVVSDSARFRVALTDIPSQMAIGSRDDAPLEQYITAISDSTKAKADYDGARNTAKIIRSSYCSGTTYAAGYCNAFTFPDGKTKGFLPSLGQLNLVYQNGVAVTTALSACGGAAMIYGKYWTSTFYGISDANGRSCWFFNWNGGTAGYSGYYLNDRNYVRPFAACP